MQKIIALALITASLVAFPVATPSFAVDTGIQAHCGPDAPEAYKRPGGYCDQVGSNSSLIESDEEEEGCSYLSTLVDLSGPAKEVIVAENCYYVPAVFI